MWLSGKESACQCRRCGFHPWVGKIPWRREWQPTPIMLPEKSHGAWQVTVHGCLKELDMTHRRKCEKADFLKSRKERED